MSGVLKGIYHRCPEPLQEFVKLAYGKIPIQIRYGKVFRDTYAFLQKSQHWSREKLEKYQLQQLRKLLHHAYENVPYYRRIFDEHDMKPDNIKTLDDLRKLPYLTKEIIQDNLENLVAKNISKSNLRFVTTAGSTGTPLGFYCERSIRSAREQAFIITQWQRVGYKFGDKHIVLRGNIVPCAKKGKFWDYDPIYNRLILSSYHLSDENLPKYIEEIKKFKPRFIRAYPSAITILARFMKENNIEPFPSVKAILCASENVYQVQRNLLEDVFSCRVFSHYGHTEQAVLAGECECSTYYHVFPEYGITELINKDGNPVSEEDEVGEIVATGFGNYAMPFIRYRTMDLGVFTNQKCKCGREYLILKRVEGRLQEMIITKDNRLIPLTALIFAQHLNAFSRVKNMQIIQEDAAEIVMKIVKAKAYSRKDEKEILQRIRKVTDNQLDVKFEYVDDIPKTRRGKSLFLIQKLPIKWVYTE